MLPKDAPIQAVKDRVIYENGSLTNMILALRSCNNNSNNNYKYIDIKKLTTDLKKQRIKILSLVKSAGEHLRFLRDMHYDKAVHILYIEFDQSSIKEHQNDLCDFFDLMFLSLAFRTQGIMPSIFFMPKSTLFGKMVRYAMIPINIWNFTKSYVNIGRNDSIIGYEKSIADTCAELNVLDSPDITAEARKLISLAGFYENFYKNYPWINKNIDFKIDEKAKGNRYYHDGLIFMISLVDADTYETIIHESIG